MSERPKQYPFDSIETKWRQKWQEAFRTSNPGEEGFDASKPKFYVLDMFPYPSGSGLHVGHVEGYTATDIIARYKRMRGFNVLHPMGWDAFGLPAEQYAIKTGQHPRATTENNIQRFRKQLQDIGFSYDWSREVNTTDPAYFRWTQWIFLKFYNSWFDPEQQKARPVAELEARRKRELPGESAASRREFLDNLRLAYVEEAPVNWCPALGTVLANEEVVDGKSEVGGHPVERRPMRQWMLRITAYAERLLNELALVDWPESVKILQRNWIGRSEGAEVHFALPDIDGQDITVFTTRPDTLFGATYMVLAPEHPLVDQLTPAEHRETIANYRREIAAKSDLERTDLAKEKTGAFIGAYAINPVNDEKLPVWIADYVLMSYGTGAIMAVPAHDDRDFEFATKFHLPIRQVVQPIGEYTGEGCFTGEGIAINSPVIDGLETAEAKRKITAWLEERGRGYAQVTYKLRDWLFSRQRYWGEPFPVYWEAGQHFALEESELPLLPPDLEDFKPTGTAEPPLAKAKEWLNISETAKRETNTMPQWAGSCWYYLRFCDPNNPEKLIDPEVERYWMNGGVDLYVGGVEHAVLHLLYARFWHKLLFDLGCVSEPEPFRKLVNQGIILGEDNQKMSKSVGNIVNPDDVIVRYGADSLRLFEMFMGPLEQMKPWSMSGVEGVHRFLGRVWRLFMETPEDGEPVLSGAIVGIPLDKPQLKILHATIKKVTCDIETLSFNTAIAQMMIFINAFTQTEKRPLAALATFLKLLSPFAPHIAEELWSLLAKRFSQQLGVEPAALLCHQAWPAYDESCLVEDEVEYIIQVNGKLRGKVILAKDASREVVEKSVIENERVQPFIEGKSIVKIVVVPGKLANIVVRSG